MPQAPPPMIASQLHRVISLDPGPGPAPHRIERPARPHRRVERSEEAEAQPLDPGPGDHRAVVGAQAPAAARKGQARHRRRARQGASRSRVLAATPPAATRLVPCGVIRGGTRRMAIGGAIDQRVADRQLDRGGEIGDGLADRRVRGRGRSRRIAVFSPENEKSQPAGPRAGGAAANRRGSPAARRALDRRPAGIAKPQQLGALVECLASRVVEGGAELAVARRRRAQTRSWQCPPETSSSR